MAEAAYKQDCLCINHTPKKKLFGMPSVAICHIVCWVILPYKKEEDKDKLLHNPKSKY